MVEALGAPSADAAIGSEEAFGSCVSSTRPPPGARAGCRSWSPWTPSAVPASPMARATRIASDVRGPRRRRRTPPPCRGGRRRRDRPVPRRLVAEPPPGGSSSPLRPWSRTAKSKGPACRPGRSGAGMSHEARRPRDPTPERALAAAEPQGAAPEASLRVDGVPPSGLVSGEDPRRSGSMAPQEGRTRRGRRCGRARPGGDRPHLRAHPRPQRAPPSSDPRPAGPTVLASPRASEDRRPVRRAPPSRAAGTRRRHPAADAARFGAVGSASACGSGPSCAAAPSGSRGCRPPARRRHGRPDRPGRLPSAPGPCPPARRSAIAPGLPSSRPGRRWRPAPGPGRPEPERPPLDDALGETAPGGGAAHPEGASDAGRDHHARPARAFGPDEVLTGRRGAVDGFGPAAGRPATVRVEVDAGARRLGSEAGPGREVTAWRRSGSTRSSWAQGRRGSP